MKIELSKQQSERFETWKKSFEPLPYVSSTGGHFGLDITFTSVGMVIFGKAWNGKEINLTEYENF